MSLPALFAAVAAAVLSAAPQAQPALPEPAAAAPAVCTLTSGTQTDFPTDSGPRKIVWRVPEGANSNTPMVVSLHGATGTSEVQEAETGWTEVAQRHGFIVAYPQSTGVSPYTVWDATGDSADAAFVAAAIETAHDSGCSNPGGTHLNGFSMGAMVTSRLACTRPDLIASAAMVGGALPPTPGCTIPPSTTIIVVHGADDTTVPFDGSMPPNLQFLAGGADLSHYPGLPRDAMAGEWLAAKGCPNPSPAAPIVEGVAVQTLWEGCGTANTWSVTYDGTGHTWNPQSQPSWATSDYLWSHTGGATPPPPAAAAETSPTPATLPRIEGAANVAVGAQLFGA